MNRAEEHPWDRYFTYQPEDQRILYLTRRLAALDINRKHYKLLFGCDPLLDFEEEVAALQEAGLLEVTPWSVRPTARGMFYGDSIAALWAWRRLGHNRRLNRQRGTPALPPELTRDRLNELANDSSFHSMG